MVDGATRLGGYLRNHAPSLSRELIQILSGD